MKKLIFIYLLLLICSNLSSKNDGQRFNELSSIVVSNNMTVIKKASIDTTYLYFFKEADLHVRKHFIGGYLAHFDESVTDEPMLSLYEFNFDSKLIASDYAKFLSVKVFLLYNFEKEKQINLLTGSCARLYRKSNTLYLIQCCWDNRLSEYF